MHFEKGHNLIRNGQISDAFYIYTISSKAIWHHTDGVVARRIVDKQPEITVVDGLLEYWYSATGD